MLFSNGKKERFQIKQQEQADEIEQLKRQLALLQNQGKVPSEGASENGNDIAPLAENSTNAEQKAE